MRTAPSARSRRSAIPAAIPAVLVAAAAVLLAVALTGCPKKKPKAAGCESSADCPDGQVCVDRTCQQCSSDDQCPDGQRCQAGACVARAECTRDADCPDGKVCKAGACQPCAADGECGPGGRCQNGACQRATACTVDEDCADDEDCVDGYCQRPWLGGGTGTCALQTIYFAFDDATIAQSERDRLDANASCIQQNGARGVIVEGHTDEAGTDEYNIALSERRARAAADYLARLGIDPARLDIVGRGETAPTGMGDAQDRRVEFRFR